jgi:HSP20 family protein
MAIIRWDPFRELSTLEHNWLRDFYTPASADDVALPGTWAPPVDIYENGKDELVIKAELPGFKPEDVSVTVEGDVLTFGGERKLAQDLREKHWRRIERRYGKFSRSFSLPPTVNADQVSAEYKDGTLTVTLPLREEAKPRRVSVKAA